MNADCRQFRARLADALRGPLLATQDPALSGLGWHAHVMHCGACRELLAEEEALDELLLSLPQPHLPRALAERVLSRLDDARRTSVGPVGLDQLLELTTAGPPPANLAERVLAGLHAERKLDRLLERLPAPSVPGGLERRVLAHLQLARRAHALSEKQRGVVFSSSAAQPRTRRLGLRIAAGFALASLSSWALWSALSERDATTTIPPVLAEVVQNAGSSLSLPQPVEALPSQVPTIAPPDDQLLASLEFFEAWELLVDSGGLDASLATLDSLDEYLLDFESTRSAPETTPAKTDPSAPAAAPKTDGKNG